MSFSVEGNEEESKEIWSCQTNPKKFVVPTRVPWHKVVYRLTLGWRPAIDLSVPDKYILEIESFEIGGTAAARAPERQLGSVSPRPN